MIRKKIEAGIFIDNNLTWLEREIQEQLKDKSKKEKQGTK